MRDEEAPVDADGNVETSNPVAEDDKLLPQPPQGPTAGKKVGAALFYATSSLGVIFANKIVLSTYRFPSVQTLALAQFTATTLALKLASLLGYVDLLPISVQGIKSILPLSTCYLLNILTGLSATQTLSLPMMVLLRRASILMVSVARREWRSAWRRRFSPTHSRLSICLQTMASSTADSRRQPRIVIRSNM